ncbi:hypothetical protein [Ensifer sp. LCM 4579]|uniref:hypothetical protein n=1 Tax=Ensifer sp. LCM 4579 TaxID=1848292 RepID=UPI00155EC1BB|nr:hypothetical protein [Ensifer sp. LCM 4579]
MTEFVIVPPEDMRESILAAADRLKAWLSGRFPGYRFRIETRPPLAGETFQVIPIMNAGSNGDAIRMAEAPAPDLLAAIREACRGFQPGRPDA